MYSKKKTALRKKYLQQRIALQDDEYEKACNHMCAQFFARIDLTSIRVLHSFLPILSKKEPDTTRILQKVMKTTPSVRIAIPRINPSLDVLESVYYRRQRLYTNKWNIREPECGEKVQHADIDLVIVPLLAFDRKGYRMGYGKGYYDRFLATCRPDCQKLGISFFPPVSHLPTDRWDIKMDGCITPTQIYLFT